MKSAGEILERRNRCGDDDWEYQMAIIKISIISCTQNALFILVGKILSSKVLNKVGVQKVIEKAWRTEEEFSITPWKDNVYAFGFKKEDDLCRVISRGPWSVMGALLVLRRWDQKKSFSELDFNFSPFWIKTTWVTAEGSLGVVPPLGVHQDPMLRPSMANVVGMLEGGYLVGVPRIESLSFPRFFGQRRKEVSRIKAHNVQNGTSVLFPQANACALVLIAVPAAHTIPFPTNRSPSFPSFHLPFYPHGYLVLREESSSPTIRQPKYTKRSRAFF
ncbi:hypothetical protein RHMOL_Rhmol02G0081600 [Rhododendron molle]|uniref:Uncharacterized protein n=1 Tax=Rhododendron molle TaxID=49168 RepID=A0ACC0PP50_RHOML|nr:hypothetical protein RHMOL_Rhmol02G0081600 [Rhododendron molle]